MISLPERTCRTFVFRDLATVASSALHAHFVLALPLHFPALEIALNLSLVLHELLHHGLVELLNVVGPQGGVAFDGSVNGRRAEASSLFKIGLDNDWERKGERNMNQCHKQWSWTGLESQKPESPFLKHPELRFF